MIRQLNNFLLLMAIFFAITPVLHAQDYTLTPGDSIVGFDLNVEFETKQVYMGINTPTFGINGYFLPPTLVLKKGIVVIMNPGNN